MSCSGPSDPARRLARVADLVGDGGVARLAAATVAVVGLGGVGSHAARALVQSGVGGLRLVDHDRITASSLNRHAVAEAADVGRSKVEVVAAWARRIDPAIRTEVLELVIDEGTVGRVVAPPVEAVIAAVDDLGALIALLVACRERGTPLVVSMGASSRTDPGRVRVGDLAAATGCPFARLLRKRLRQRGLAVDLKVVFSSEPPRAPFEADRVDDDGSPRRSRHRQASLMMLPGIFGYALANEVVLDLAGVGR